MGLSDACRAPEGAGHPTATMGFGILRVTGGGPGCRLGSHEPDTATDGGDLLVDIAASASSLDCDRSLGLREGGSPRVALGSSHGV